MSKARRELQDRFNSAWWFVYSLQLAGGWFNSVVMGKMRVFAHMNDLTIPGER